MARRFPVYVMVQCVAYCLDMGGFVLLRWCCGTSPLLANIAAKIAAGLLAFWLHRKVTFRVDGGSGLRAELARYWLLFVVNVPVASALLALCLRWMSPEPLAKLVADAIGVGLTFLATQYLVFGATREGRRD